MDKRESMILLVDSAHGVYAWHSLATRYPLFVHWGDQPVPLDEWLPTRAEWDHETVETVFHPDNEYWCEHVEFIAYHNVLKIKNDDDGLLYDVYQGDGDIWAIHPDAKWDEDKNQYVIPTDQHNKSQEE